MVTPLNEALRTKNHDMVALLIKNGAQAKGLVQEDESPVLFQVLEHDDCKLIELLLEHGASLEDYDNQGNPPLYYAVGRVLRGICDFKVVELLVKRGAKIDQTNAWDKTVFDFVKLKENQKLAGFLRGHLKS